ncbi:MULTISPECIES: LysR family transcriptional regulator [unclassified Micromonospora]|uniref:LysR family transcriptional regulator n=1 Tax=unclassified Micromonospora TaxID=2617518 RepID=UPI00249C53A3|nr:MULTISPECIES: LysR family transcriptional regulator [unclassified Micromonospora]WFE49188.1 LysR family transcriptional regulator [Micromonospora sp. WMMD1155]WFF04028.1 LysR family transcriptional regulator [Micromonospora sp. WMMD964]
MQLHQLRYFVAVAEVRHFTQAADIVGITQPSLSKQIHALEADLGAPLFERVRGNIALTAAGEVLLPLATRILADVETATREVQELAGLRRGRVRLGATPSLATSLAPPVLRRFRDAHPTIDLRVEEGGSQDLVRDLLRGDLDLALIIMPAQGPDPGLRVDPILRESLVVASVDEVPTAAATGELRITDLRDQPMVMFREGYDLRDATIQACREAGFEPSFAVDGGEMDAVLSFVEAGLGIALVPGIVLARRPGVRITPLAPPGVRRTIAVARRRDIVPTHAGRELRRILLDYIQSAIDRGELPPGVEPLT